jgi:TPR repeat protein
MLRALVLALAIALTPAPQYDFETAIALGLRHLQGLGVPRDHPRALMWFYVARSRNAAADTYVRMVEPYLTAAQISEAQALAESCIADNTACALIAER